MECKCKNAECEIEDNFSVEELTGVWRTIVWRCRECNLLWFEEWVEHYDTRDED